MKTYTNLIINGKIKHFSPKTKIKTRISILLLLFNFVMKVLASITVQEKEWNKIKKGRKNLFLFVGHMTAYVDYPKEQATIKSKVTRHKINIPKSMVFIIQFVNIIFGI